MACFVENSWEEMNQVLHLRRQVFQNSLQASYRGLLPTYLINMM